MVKSLVGFFLSLAGLILGILAGFPLFLTYLTYAAFPLSAAGAIISSIAVKQHLAEGKKHTLALWGLVLGGLAAISSGIIFFTCGVCGIVYGA